eukprot:c26321_g1_i1 orf=358-1092(-)
MEQGDEGEINGWDAARDERYNGWPLGLQPVNARLSITSSNFLITTPSLTSFSSSDFDTESTQSFFPEKSTTLGSLIGFESSSENAIMQSHSIQDEGMTRKSNRNRLWCPLLGCGGGLQEDHLEPSPSLARLLDNQKRDALSLRQTTSSSVEEHTQEEAIEQAEFDINGILSHGDTIYNNTCTVPSRPSSPSLRVILQQPSPTSYHYSNWNVCGDLSHHQHVRGHNRSHSFWPNLCGKLSTSLAN